MKRNAVITLIKDIILAVAAWGIFTFLLTALDGNMDPSDARILALLFAGIPFGWRWASNIITAVSFKGIGIKLAISLFLGWFAIVVVMITDIIRCIAERSENKKTLRRLQTAE